MARGPSKRLQQLAGFGGTSPVEIVAELDKASRGRLKLLATSSRTAAAKVLTFTAEKAKPQWISAHRAFHKRNGWIDMGVRLRPATSSDLNAQVGTLDAYMQRHVVGLGEVKKPGRASKLFVPIYDDISQVQGHKYYKRLLKRSGETKRKVFQPKGKSYLMRRTGKAASTAKIIGFLKGSTMSKPDKIDALGIVNRVVQREFTPAYERVLLGMVKAGKL